MEIEETGATALGPAVATAVSMASEGAPGSTVVICTDGLANVGLGAFDMAVDPQDIEIINKFYEKVGNLAKEKGITINIVSIKGEECNLDSIQMLSDLTGGEVSRVDPVTLTQNFASMMAMPVIASNVQIKIMLHKGLCFRNENPDYLSEDKSIMTKDQGNVTEEDNLTFEYTMKPMKELIEMDDIDITQIKQFPF